MSSGQSTATLAALMRGRIVSAELLDDLIRLGDGNDGKLPAIIVCRLRKRLAPFDIKIDTFWGRGYQMPKASIDILNRMMADFEGANLKENA